MNKVVRYLLFVFCSCVLHPLEAAEYSIEVRSAALLHTSESFRSIYGTVNPDFQIEASKTLSSPFELWGNLDYFYKDAGGDCCSSDIQVGNFSIGVKYAYSFYNNFDIYLGPGFSIGIICLSNKACCGDNNDSRVALGGVIKSGVRYYFLQRAFVDLFADYLYQPVNYKPTVDVGGFKLGIGLGLSF